MTKTKMKPILILILLLSAWTGSVPVTLANQSLWVSETPFFQTSEPGENLAEFGGGVDQFSGLGNDNFNWPSETRGGLGSLPEILPPDEAFIWQVYLESPSVLVAQWKIAEGCYLYRDQFQFALNGGGVLGEAEFPPGIFKEDIKYGRVEVYEQELQVKLPIQETQGLEALTLQFGYQGCVEDRMCYPPIEKTAFVTLPNLPPSMTVVDNESIRVPEGSTVDDSSANRAVAAEPGESAVDESDDQSNLDDSSANQTVAPKPDLLETEHFTKDEANLQQNDAQPSPDQAPPNQSWLTQLTSLFGSGANERKFLEADQAFVFSAELLNSSQIVVRWQIADGYYLFKEKFKFSLTDELSGSENVVLNEKRAELGEPQFPPSLLKKDPLFGDSQIYQQPLLEIIVPIETMALQTGQLMAQYQGCAVSGYCYPPITKVVDLVLQSDKPAAGISESDRLANLLENASLWYTLIVFFGLGLLLSLTPCILPMIPILSSIIVGQGEQVTTYKAFILSLTYVLAMAITYAIAGVLMGLLGENVPAAFQNPWVLGGFALLFVVLALSMFGFYELQMPSALQTRLTLLSHRQQSGTLIGVAIMGILSALIVGPCVAAPLVGALIYISQTGDALLGGLALFSLSLGMGIPLILVGISAGHLLPKAAQWMESVKAIFGVMLLAVAIWMIERVIPGEVTMLLWATLLIVSSIYMGALTALPAGVSGWRKLWKGLGLVLLVYGILLIIGAASGNVNPLQPLQNLRFNHNASGEAAAKAAPSLPFKPIKGVNGLQQELAAAQAQNQPVMLDFYADWCVSCKEMEYFTFSDAGVQQQLAQFVLLKADVTSNDEQDKALYKHFGIFGPPAFLFFDTDGEEQRADRVVGFMSAEQFLQHLIAFQKRL